jgi:hypothetical protein
MPEKNTNFPVNLTNGNCWVYIVTRAIYDTTFKIETLQGESLGWMVYQRYDDADQSGLIS